MEYTRELIIKLSNELIRGQTKHEDLIDLIVSYCLEYNKDKNESVVFAAHALSSIFAHNIVKECLEYYQKKFNVCIITNINTGEILSIF